MELVLRRSNSWVSDSVEKAYRESVRTYGKHYTTEISCKLEMSLCWVIPERYNYCTSCSGCGMSSVLDSAFMHSMYPVPSLFTI